jgi:hypothetical protein
MPVRPKTLVSVCLSVCLSLSVAHTHTHSRLFLPMQEYVLELLHILAILGKGFGEHLHTLVPKLVVIQTGMPHAPHDPTRTQPSAPPHRPIQIDRYRQTDRDREIKRARCTYWRPSSLVVLRMMAASAAALASVSLFDAKLPPPRPPTPPVSANAASSCGQAARRTPTHSQGRSHGCAHSMLQGRDRL